VVVPGGRGNDTMVSKNNIFLMLYPSHVCDPTKPNPVMLIQAKYSYYSNAFKQIYLNNILIYDKPWHK
jgi:hypothetical protein